MPLTAFDHVNVRTSNLDAMISWYATVLDLHAGPRPDFGFPGAWLYLGDQAIIHLVQVAGQPKAAGDVTLEHFALRATNMADFLAALETHGVEARISAVSGLPIVQVNIFDPDGNHIHIDFDSAEYNG